MKITISQICENIAKKTSLDVKDLSVEANFPLNGADISKNEENPRRFLYWKYSELSEKDKLMYLSIYYKDLNILEMDIQGISPNDNKMYQILDIGLDFDCIGPGFYYWYAYFKIDGLQAKDEKSKQNYNKFFESAEFDPKNITNFKSNLNNLTLADIVKMGQVDNEGEA